MSLQPCIYPKVSTKSLYGTGPKHLKRGPSWRLFGLYVGTAKGKPSPTVLGPWGDKTTHTPGC